MGEFIPITVYIYCKWRMFSWLDFYNVVTNLINLKACREANFQIALIS